MIARTLDLDASSLCTGSIRRSSVGNNGVLADVWLQASNSRVSRQTAHGETLVHRILKAVSLDSLLCSDNITEVACEVGKGKWRADVLGKRKTARPSARRHKIREAMIATLLYDDPTAAVAAARLHAWVRATKNSSAANGGMQQGREHRQAPGQSLRQIPSDASSNLGTMLSTAPLLAIEAQASPQSAGVTRARSLLHAESGVQSVWVFSDRARPEDIHLSPECPSSTESFKVMKDRGDMPLVVSIEDPEESWQLATIEASARARPSMGASASGAGKAANDRGMRFSSNPTRREFNAALEALELAALANNLSTSTSRRRNSRSFELSCKKPGNGGGTLTVASRSRVMRPRDSSDHVLAEAPIQRMAEKAREVSQAFACSVPVRWPTPLLLGPGWWRQPREHMHQGTHKPQRLGLPEVATGWVHRHRPPQLKLAGNQPLDSTRATLPSASSTTSATSATPATSALAVEDTQHDANATITLQDVLRCAAKGDIAEADVLLGAVIEVVLPTVASDGEQSDGQNLIALLSSGPRAQVPFECAAPPSRLQRSLLGAAQRFLYDMDCSGAPARAYGTAGAFAKAGTCSQPQSTRPPNAVKGVMHVRQVVLPSFGDAPAHGRAENVTWTGSQSNNDAASNRNTKKDRGFNRPPSSTSSNRSTSAHEEGWECIADAALGGGLYDSIESQDIISHKSHSDPLRDVEIEASEPEGANCLAEGNVDAGDGWVIEGLGGSEHTFDPYDGHLREMEQMTSGLQLDQIYARDDAGVQNGGAAATTDSPAAGITASGTIDPDPVNTERGMHITIAGAIRMVLQDMPRGAQRQRAAAEAGDVADDSRECDGGSYTLCSCESYAECACKDDDSRGMPGLDALAPVLAFSGQLLQPDENQGKTPNAAEQLMQELWQLQGLEQVHVACKVRRVHGVLLSFALGAGDGGAPGSDSDWKVASDSVRRVHSWHLLPGMHE